MGRQEAFSKELCLRAFYHLDRAWSAYVPSGGIDPNLSIVRIAQGVFERYDALQRGEQKPVDALPEDHVARADKLAALVRVRQHLQGMAER